MSFNLFLALLIVAGFALLIYLTNRKFRELAGSEAEKESRKMLLEWLKSTQQSQENSARNTQTVLDALAKTVNESLRASTADVSKTLQENTKQLNERLDKAAEVIGGVQKNLGAMEEASVYLKDLHQLLQAPKLRGNIGEQILYDLLKQHFPVESVKLQHTFRSGEKVDALIVTADGNVPVDSKFPMDTFKRYLSCVEPLEREKSGKEFVKDVKGHIDAVARKYILPEEGTMDRAIMYVPSEPVVYEIVNNFHDLVDYAYQKNVVIASPSMFTQYLKVILFGFERQQVAREVNQILSSLKAIRIEAGKFSDDLRLTVKHITNAKNAADESASSFSRLEGKISSIQLAEPKQTDLLE
ncbi:MAG: DNA recombination protein RmuC [Patescibacteria group bacterium]|nr:DNA recombination protein RmuC [Patescibacteria group bacterium]